MAHAKTLKFHAQTLRQLTPSQASTVAGATVGCWGTDGPGYSCTNCTQGPTWCGTCDNTCSGCGSTADCPIYG